jgi:hypothetical protein
LARAARLVVFESVERPHIASRGQAPDIAKILGLSALAVLWRLEDDNSARPKARRSSKAPPEVATQIAERRNRPVIPRFVLVTGVR